MNRDYGRCMICRHSGEIVCRNCQRYLRLYEDSGHDQNIVGLDGYVIGRHYDKIIQAMIHQLKYGKPHLIASRLGSRLATIIHISELIDLIGLHQGAVLVTFVPTHRFKRRCSRGYNQAEVLARSIAGELGLPCQSLLRKTRRTRSQVRVDRSHRATNLVDSFKSKSNDIDPQLIILVDDVITTGSTMTECARILHDQYPHTLLRGVGVTRNR